MRRGQQSRSTIDRGCGETVDAISFAGVSLLFLAIALLAAYLPFRRAMRVDPLVALRYE